MMSGLQCLLAFLLVATTGYGKEIGKTSQLALANNYLALNLHRLITSEGASNVFTSPLSISTAFGMLYYGTRGESAREMRKTFGYNVANLKENAVHSTFHNFLSNLKSANGEYVLDAANAILVDKDYGLIPEYRNGVQELYQAEVKDVDFKTNSKEVVEELNNWVKDKTRGKIDSLVKELSPSTSLVLVNAVYFKGTWKTQFDVKYTFPRQFYNEGLTSGVKKVPMMHMTHKFRFGKVLNSKVLEMPYKGEEVSMVVILPDQLDGLRDIERELTLEKLDTIRSQLRVTKIDVALPKFKIEYERELSEDLKKLGTRKIFGSEADFSGMTKEEGYAVSAVIHKAVVEVNEEGSEAAAVTGIIVTNSAIGDTPDFVVDRPFAFAIVHAKSRMILFQGRVNVL